MKAKITRWNSGAAGRSKMVACQNLLWLVATVANVPDFKDEVVACLDLLEKSLLEAGSDKTRLLSVQVILRQIENRDVFNSIWLDWIGPDAGNWPQRAVFGAALAPGLSVEIVATAAIM